MRKLLVFVACFLVLFNINVNALELSSNHLVLFNLNEDKVIYEMNMDEETNIASLTKIMTTLVALEHIDDYNKKITMKREMFKGLAEANAAVIGLKTGQVVTYNDLLYGMFVASGADATRGITMSIAGSEEAFVELMNKKAEELKLKHTKFSDTTGLDEANQYSTVSDVAVVLKEALKNEKFKELFVAESYVLSDRSITIYSTLRKTASVYKHDVSYIEGAKTGYNTKSGKCLASIAYDKENDIRYMLVTTGASTDKSDAYNIKDAVTVYKYYFENFKYHDVVLKDELLVKIPTKYGSVSEVDFKAKNNISYYLENTFNKDEVILKYEGIDLITTKMNIGDKLGKIDVIYNDEVLATVDVVLEEKVNFSLKVFVKENLHIIIPSVILFILIIVLISILRKKKKRKRKK